MSKYDLLYIKQKNQYDCDLDGFIVVDWNYEEPSAIIKVEDIIDMINSLPRRHLDEIVDRLTKGEIEKNHD